jgi:hypothetical protein
VFPDETFVRVSLSGKKQSDGFLLRRWNQINQQGWVIDLAKSVGREVVLGT